MKIIEFLIKIIHCLFDYKFFSYIKKIKRNFYSIWIAFEFKKTGKHVIINKDLYLLGGQYIEIGNNVSIGKNGVLTAWNKFQNDTFIPQIRIGNAVNIVGMNISRTKEQFDNGLQINGKKVGLRFNNENELTDYLFEAKNRYGAVMIDYAYKTVNILYTYQNHVHYVLDYYKRIFDK